MATDTNSHLLALPESRHVPTALTCSNDFDDLKLDVPTLAAANVLSRTTSATGKSEYRSGSQIVQVTRDAVLLMNTQLGIREDRWIPGQGRNIVVADISPSQICLAVSGGLVVLLNILQNKILEKMCGFSCWTRMY